MFQFFEKRTKSLRKVNLSRINNSFKSVFRISYHFARLIVTLEISNITHLNSNDACEFDKDRTLSLQSFYNQLGLY